MNNDGKTLPPIIEDFSNISENKNKEINLISGRKDASQPFIIKEEDNNHEGSLNIINGNK